jgi:hypothetical protein
VVREPEMRPTTWSKVARNPSRWMNSGNLGRGRDLEEAIRVSLPPNKRMNEKNSHK